MTIVFLKKVLKAIHYYEQLNDAEKEHFCSLASLVRDTAQKEEGEKRK